MFSSLQICVFLAVGCVSTMASLITFPDCPPTRLKNKVMLDMEYNGTEVIICRTVPYAGNGQYPFIFSTHLNGSFLVLLVQHQPNCKKQTKLYYMEKVGLWENGTNELEKLFDNLGMRNKNINQHYVMLLYRYTEDMYLPKKEENQSNRKPIKFDLNLFENANNVFPSGYFAFSLCNN